MKKKQVVTLCNHLISDLASVRFKLAENRIVEADRLIDNIQNVLKEAAQSAGR